MDFAKTVNLSTFNFGQKNLLGDLIYLKTRIKTSKCN